MDEAQAAANPIAAAFMESLSEALRERFPFHAMALRGEILGTRLTTDRWNRIAYVLASLHSVPGFPLTSDEHDVRRLGLQSVVVARKMAAASFGGRDPVGCRELALWLAAEIGRKLKPERGAQDG